MPTIELIGFGPLPKKGNSNSLETRIFKALKAKDLGLTEDIVIVNHPDSTVRNYTGESKPFIRVLSMSEGKFEKIRGVINEVGNFDIEYTPMSNFFPAKKSEEKT